MSHIKNMQAFGKLTGICTGLGGNYNPGKQNLQVNAMTTLLNSAQQTMDDVIKAQTSYDNVVINRDTGFKDVRKLSSGICNVLKACNVHPRIAEDALASTRRIWGRRGTMPEATPTAADATALADKARTQHGRDYATQTYYFAKLVSLVTDQPKYLANEPTLTVEGLQAKLAEVKALNDAVTQAELVLNGARKGRDVIYYTGDDSLFSTAQAAKRYVRGVFGYRSTEHLELNRLHFTKPQT